MSILYYHPLGMDNYDTVTGTTYSNHGLGKLDFGGNNMPIYSMCDGEVAFCGLYTDGTSCCAISCSENGLNTTFYIRYIHGIYQVQVGDQVTRGQLIGYTSDIGAKPGQYHLHLDFSTTPNSFIPVEVELNNDRTFTYNGRTYPIRDSVDLGQVKQWMLANGAGGNKCGYCWLVMASAAEIITPGGLYYDERMDVSKKINLSERDWLAIYGMWQYEEGGIFEHGDAYEIAAGISEWVVRVTRNRLLAGVPLDNICLWNWDPNTGQWVPGRARAEQLGQQVNEETRQFIKNIILGNNYYYAEQIALQYRYTQDPYAVHDDVLWQRHLYAADTFSGASSPSGVRWITMAAIPFWAGYFFMEGAFSEAVQRQWNNNFYPNNPYFAN